MNLYKLFVERSFHLLRLGGHCGIVIPSGIYTDLGAKGLRDLLFGQTQIEGLFCFENRKEIFEGVHRSFKFVVLTFEKSAQPRLQQAGEANASAPPDDLLAPQAVEAAGGSGTTRFPAAFMRHDVEELARFPAEGALWLEVELIRKLSPEALLVMEFKNELDLVIVQKLHCFPRINEAEKIGMKVKFVNEFHMTNDSHLFSTVKRLTDLPLYEGSTFWQFDGKYAESRYFLSATDIENNLPTRSETGNWKTHRDIKLAVRLIASTTNERTLIAAAIPAKVVSNHNVGVVVTHGLSENPYIALLYLMSLFNSFTLDWLIRMEGATYIKFSSLYRLPLPSIGATGGTLDAVVNRAARLICTTPEFDDLAQAVGLKSGSPRPSALPAGEGERSAEATSPIQYGATDPSERARLRAELDGLVAHLYGLTEAEFAHILGTFPLVAEPVKVAALTAWRDVQTGLIQ